MAISPLQSPPRYVRFASKQVEMSIARMMSIKWSQTNRAVGMFCTTSILQAMCDWRFQLHLWLAIVWGKPPFGLIINAPTCFVAF
jgi:hypothetical protein